MKHSGTSGSRVWDRLAITVLLAAPLCAGHGPSPTPHEPPKIEGSVMTALWRMDETLDEDTIADSGPLALR